MKKLTSLALVLVTAHAFAQAPLIQWEKSLGGTNDEYANTMQLTGDGGSIVAGYSRSNDGDVTGNHGASDYWVVKLTSGGTIQWEKSYGGTANDNASSIRQTFDGGYIVAGTSNSADGDVSFNHGLDDYWLVKLDSIGNIRWEKSYGGTNTDEITFITQTTDSGYVISGYANSNDGDVSVNLAGPEYWIVKTDTGGTIQWEKVFGGQSGDEAYSAIPTSDGGYCVGGRSGSTDGDVVGNHGVWDFWLLKLDSNGIAEWKQCYGGPWDEGATMMLPTSDGGYLAAGHAMLSGGDVSSGQGGHDFWVVKLNGTDGISETVSSNGIRIFPNPAGDEIHIQIDAALTGTAYSITDPAGRIVGTGRLQQENSLVSLQTLAPGIYFFRLAGEQRALRVVKVR